MADGNSDAVPAPITSTGAIVSQANNAIVARFYLQRPASGSGPGFTLDIDIALPATGISAIFGRSGSGKSTFLRCVAGLERPQRGHFSIGDQTWQDTHTFLPTHRRPLGYVFQEASLFPHLTARANLDYARRRASPPRSAQLNFSQVVSLLGIELLLDRFPDQLSGGERQRVAIARALLVNPRLLLMDEPMASLDESRKGEILPYLERLRDELQLPILYVSHSAAEITRLAHHVVVLEEGRPTASGSLGEVLARIDPPVQLGEEAGVVLQGCVEERDAQWHLVRVAFEGGDLWVRDEGDALGQPVRVRILARDISLALAESQDSSITNRLPVQVVQIVPDTHPAMCLVQLRSGPTTLIARVTRRSAAQLRVAAGVQLWAQIKSVALVR